VGRGTGGGGGYFSRAMICGFLPARAAGARAVAPPVNGATKARRHRGRVLLPLHAPGMRIGLFGGTFDPPHAAHRAACLLAMHRLGLDRVWWLGTPGNPPEK